MIPALTRGLESLAARQRADGYFPIRVDSEAPSEGAADDPSIFATTLIATALRHCDGELAVGMADRAARFVAEQMESPGVWRHWTREHPQFHALPADLDDTACASILLQGRSVTFPDNRAVLLANRDPRGLFFTWLIARRPLPRPGSGAWRPILRRGARPVHARLFWRTSAAPDDVDGVVNANVLAYLGDGPHAPPVVDHLLGILRRGEEDRCDKWYRSPSILHHALARCAAAGVAGIAAAGPLVCQRIADRAGADGRIGTGPADTALALSALVEWGGPRELREAAAAYLECVQGDDGGWPAEPVYFGGPRHEPAIPSWGSAELTTGFCVEALARQARADDVLGDDR